MQKKLTLLERIKEFDLSNNEVVFTLDEFFDGNNNIGSIGVNIYPDQPTPQAFYQAFKSLLNNNRVDKIFVRIVDIEDPEDWFYTDTIYVIGDLTTSELDISLKHLSFTEIHEGWMYGEPINIGELDKSKKIFSIWWD